MDSNIAEPIFEIEKQHPGLHRLEYNGLNVWTILRYILRIHIANGKHEKPAPAFRERIFHFRSALRILAKAIVFPLRNPQVFRKYDVVVFSNQFEKRLLDGAVIDKLSSGLIAAYEKKGYKVLVVNYGDSAAGKFTAKNIVNGRILGEAAWNIYPGFLLKGQAKKIRAALGEFDSIINSRLIIKELNFYLGLIWIYRLLYRIWQPKLVFMPDYSSFSEIYAANTRGIHTVELQHGNINEYHPGYVAYSPVNRNFYSKRMLLFGENSRLHLPGAIYGRDEMLVAGNYYLSKLRCEQRPEKIISIISRYKVSICVPYDITDEAYIFDFLQDAVKRFHEAAFIFSIRYAASEKILTLQDEFANVYIEKDVPFQKIVLCCDYNMCSFSTCALEALALGKPNILITKDPRTRLYYENKLDPRFSFFVNTIDDLEAIIDASTHFDPEQVRLSNEKNIAHDYDLRLTGIISRLNRESGLHLNNLQTDSVDSN
jgi:hypothetical protein